MNLDRGVPYYGSVVQLFTPALQQTCSEIIVPTNFESLILFKYLAKISITRICSCLFIALLVGVNLIHDYMNVIFFLNLVMLRENVKVP